MKNPNDPKLRYTIQLKPGLILIRLKAEKGAQPSTFNTLLPQTNEDCLVLVSNPLSADSALRKDGDCVVLRCSKAAVIQIEIQLARGETNPSGILEVEYLTSNASRHSPSSTQLGSAPRRSSQRQPSEGSCFMAHIANHGDAYFQLGDWIGSPMKCDALEALAIRPDVPTLPKLMMLDHMTGQTASPGEILGKRGQSIPLRSIDMWLADPKCVERLQIEALFRKSGHIRLIGKRVSLTGSDEGDVLLGLRVRISSPLRKHIPQGDTSRVQIFRAV